MDIKSYEKLNKRAKEIAFRKAMDAIQKHIDNAIEECEVCDKCDDDPLQTHLMNAKFEVIDLKAMALFARFQDPKKWWELWR